MTVTATVTLTDDQGNVVATESSSFEVASNQPPQSILSTVKTKLTPGRH